MTKDEALKMCLEYIETDAHERKYVRHAIKEALAQPEQPKVRTGNCLRVGVCASEGHKIQPQHTWVGLTDDEISLCSKGNMTRNGFARTIESKLKEKNVICKN